MGPSWRRPNQAFWRQWCHCPGSNGGRVVVYWTYVFVYLQLKNCVCIRQQAGRARRVDMECLFLCTFNLKNVCKQQTCESYKMIHPDCDTIARVRTVGIVCVWVLQLKCVWIFGALRSGSHPLHSEYMTCEQQTILIPSVIPCQRIHPLLCVALYHIFLWSISLSISIALAHTHSTGWSIRFMWPRLSTRCPR